MPGIRVGHWTDRRAATGCTVVLCEKGAVGGVDVRGGAGASLDTLRTSGTCPLVVSLSNYERASTALVAT